MHCRTLVRRGRGGDHFQCASSGSVIWLHGSKYTISHSTIQQGRLRSWMVNGSFVMTLLRDIINGTTGPFIPVIRIAGVIGVNAHPFYLRLRLQGAFFYSQAYPSDIPPSNALSHCVHDLTLRIAAMMLLRLRPNVRVLDRVVRGRKKDGRTWI